MAGNRRAEKAPLIRDAKLEERAPLHDVPRPRRVVDSRKLHHEPAAPCHLDHRLHGPELIQPGAHDALGAADRVLTIAYDRAALVGLQGQVDAAAKIQAERDRDAAKGGVAHVTRGRVGARRVTFRGTRDSRLAATSAAIQSKTTSNGTHATDSLENRMSDRAPEIPEWDVRRAALALGRTEWCAGFSVEDWWSAGLRKEVGLGCRAATCSCARLA